MRRLFLALFLALVACDGDKTETVNLGEDCVTCPRLDVPASAAPINERTDCPSQVIDSRLWQRAFGGLIDPINQSKFDAWAITFNNHGKTVDATFFYEGSYYRVRWTQENGGLVQIWDRATSPFELGLAPENYAGTIIDIGYTGCVNFGVGRDADPGKMQWNDGDDWQVHYHGDWQARYKKGFEGLSSILGMK